MFQNPWQVDSIQAFTCLKCPECTFFTKEDLIFQDHAKKNHPLSLTLFIESKENVSQTTETIKPEQLDSPEFSISIKQELDETNIYVSKSENKPVDHGNKQLIYEQDPLKISNEGIETFICTITCSNTFSSKDNLDKHILTAHKSKLLPKKSIKCDICDLSFAEKQQLKEHIESVHGGKKKRFTCTICVKNFSSKLRLKRHLSSPGHLFMKGGNPSPGHPFMKGEKPTK